MAVFRIERTRDYNANRRIISRVNKMTYNILRNYGGDSTWKISITQMR